MENKALIIFAKNPVLGKVKTRLAKDLGDEKALDIYTQALDIVYAYTKNLPWPKLVYWDGGIPMNSCFAGNGFMHKAQLDGLLGARMSLAFENELKTFSSVCIIGTDCVELTEGILLNAFEILDDNNLVIGPALDGGYYLLGMKQLHLELFSDISWSTSTVFEETHNRILKLGLSVSTLPILSDIDTFEDYFKMKEKNLIL